MNPKQMLKASRVIENMTDLDRAKEIAISFVKKERIIKDIRAKSTCQEVAWILGHVALSNMGMKVIR